MYALEIHKAASISRKTKSSPLRGCKYDSCEKMGNSIASRETERIPVEQIPDPTAIDESKEKNKALPSEMLVPDVADLIQNEAREESMKAEDQKLTVTDKVIDETKEIKQKALVATEHEKISESIKHLPVEVIVDSKVNLRNEIEASRMPLASKQSASTTDEKNLKIEKEALLSKELSDKIDKFESELDIIEYKEEELQESDDEVIVFDDDRLLNVLDEDQLALLSRFTAAAGEEDFTSEEVENFKILEQFLSNMQDSLESSVEETLKKVEILENKWRQTEIQESNDMHESIIAAEEALDASTLIPLTAEKVERTTFSEPKKPPQLNKAQKPRSYTNRSTTNDEFECIKVNNLANIAQLAQLEHKKRAEKKQTEAVLETSAEVLPVVKSILTTSEKLTEAQLLYKKRAEKKQAEALLETSSEVLPVVETILTASEEVMGKKSDSDLSSGKFTDFIRLKKSQEDMDVEINKQFKELVGVYKEEEEIEPEKESKKNSSDEADYKRQVRAQSSGTVLETDSYSKNRHVRARSHEAASEMEETLSKIFAPSQEMVFKEIRGDKTVRARSHEVASEMENAISQIFERSQDMISKELISAHILKQNLEITNSLETTGEVMALPIKENFLPETDLQSPVSLSNVPQEALQSQLMNAQSYAVLEHTTDYGIDKVKTNQEIIMEVLITEPEQCIPMTDDELLHDILFKSVTEKVAPIFESLLPSENVMIRQSEISVPQMPKFSENQNVEVGLRYDDLLKQSNSNADDPDKEWSQLLHESMSPSNEDVTEAENLTAKDGKWLVGEKEMPFCPVQKAKSVQSLPTRKYGDLTEEEQKIWFQRKKQGKEGDWSLLVKDATSSSYTADERKQGASDELSEELTQMILETKQETVQETVDINEDKNNVFEKMEMTEKQILEKNEPKQNEILQHIIDVHSAEVKKVSSLKQSIAQQIKEKEALLDQIEEAEKIYRKSLDKFPLLPNTNKKEETENNANTEEPRVPLKLSDSLEGKDLVKPKKDIKESVPITTEKKKDLQKKKVESTNRQTTSKKLVDPTIELQPLPEKMKKIKQEVIPDNNFNPKDQIFKAETVTMFQLIPEGNQLKHDVQKDKVLPKGSVEAKIETTQKTSAENMTELKPIETKQEIKREHISDKSFNQKDQTSKTETVTMFKLIPESNQLKHDVQKDKVLPKGSVEAKIQTTQKIPAKMTESNQKETKQEIKTENIPDKDSNQNDKISKTETVTMSQSISEGNQLKHDVQKDKVLPKGCVKEKIVTTQKTSAETMTESKEIKRKQENKAENISDKNCNQKDQISKTETVTMSKLISESNQLKRDVQKDKVLPKGLVETKIETTLKTPAEKMTESKQIETKQEIKTENISDKNFNKKDQISKTETVTMSQLIPESNQLKHDVQKDKVLPKGSVEVKNETTSKNSAEKMTESKQIETKQGIKTENISDKNCNQKDKISKTETVTMSQLIPESDQLKHDVQKDKVLPKGSVDPKIETTQKASAEKMTESKQVETKQEIKIENISDKNFNQKDKILKTETVTMSQLIPERNQLKHDVVKDKVLPKGAVERKIERQRFKDRLKDKVLPKRSVETKIETTQKTSAEKMTESKQIETKQEIKTENISDKSFNQKDQISKRETVTMSQLIPESNQLKHDVQKDKVLPEGSVEAKIETTQKTSAEKITKSKQIETKQEIETENIYTEKVCADSYEREIAQPLEIKSKPTAVTETRQIQTGVQSRHEWSPEVVSGMAVSNILTDKLSIMQAVVNQKGEEVTSSLKTIQVLNPFAVGQSARLLGEVVVPRAKATWYKNNELITLPNRRFLSVIQRNSRQLIIQNIIESDAGVYQMWENGSPVAEVTIGIESQLKKE